MTVPTSISARRCGTNEVVVGWADLRMPRTMHGQRDAKVIAEIAKGLISLEGESVIFEKESNFGKNNMEFFNV